MSLSLKTGKAALLYSLYGKGYSYSSNGGIMQITDVRIRKIEGEGNLRGYVTVTFENCFVVHNIKVFEGKNGLFISMPNRRTASGEYKDVAHPISAGFRNDLQQKIIDEYNAGHIRVGRFDED